MDDLIKRSEAIDAIRQWVKMNQYYHPFSKGKTIPVDEAIDQLERVQAEQPSAQPSLYELINEAHNGGYDVGYWAGRRDYEQKWIPVTERLPDKHGYYIVQTDGSHNAVIDIAEYGMFFQPEHEDVCEWNKASKVIAWMPLPEPYKESE